MFKPNQRCRIQLSGGNDVYGQPKPGVFVSEGCSIVKLMIVNQKSSVRADSSASRGNARELQADCVLLMTVATKAKVDDIIQIAGAKFKISGRFPRHDVNGRLDHVEIHAMMWSDK
jgi:hypothetical protein